MIFNKREIPHHTECTASPNWIQQKKWMSQPQLCIRNGFQTLLYPTARVQPFRNEVLKGTFNVYSSRWNNS